MLIVLWILMSTSYGLQVNKCCPNNQLLDASTLQCVAEELPPERMTNFLPSYMLNLTSKQSDLARSLITMQLQPEDINYGLKTNCESYKLLDLTKPLEYLISTRGSLISMAGIYAPTQDLGQFCIETALLRSKLTYRSALICDPCHIQSCVKSCCSHLQTANFTEDGSYTCQNAPKFTPKALAPASYQNLTLVAKPRLELCDANDTKLMVSSADFLLEGNTVIASKLPPKYKIKDFCLAFGEEDDSLGMDQA